MLAHSLRLRLRRTILRRAVQQRQDNRTVPPHGIPHDIDLHQHRRVHVLVNDDEAHPPQPQPADEGCIQAGDLDVAAVVWFSAVRCDPALEGGLEFAAV